jgi:hypothetical protein
MLLFQSAKMVNKSCILFGDNQIELQDPSVSGASVPPTKVHIAAILILWKEWN